MSQAITFETTQPQVVQLEVQFKAPSVKGQQVELLTDLTSFNVVWNYDYKLVFVNESQSFYYLKPTYDGSLVSHWNKHTTSTTIELYNPSKAYVLGSVVYLNSKIYSCITNTIAGTLSNREFWIIISGEAVTNRYLLTAVSSLIIYTEIKNPIFEAVECTFDVDVLDTDGLVKMNNPIYGEPNYTRSTNLDDNGGQAYNISFEENMLPYLFTGVVNVR